MSKTDKDSKNEEKACLASSFARADKFSEIEKITEMTKQGSYVDDNFVALAQKLIESGKTKEASGYVSYLLKRNEDDQYELEKFVKILVKLERDDEAMKVANQLDESDKVDSYFEIADVYLEKSKPEKALNIIESISELVEKSKYDRDKAKLGLYYAKLGREEKSLKFSQISLKNVVWTMGIPEYEDGRIIDYVFESYLLLGKYELAGEMLAKQGKTEDSSSLIKIAQSYLTKNNRKKADEYLERSLKILNPDEYGDSFDLGDLIEIYVKLGEVEKALNITKNLIGSEYMRQRQLLTIADVYLKKGDQKTASEILGFALEQTKKINTDAEESGILWTSGKWNQARYQSQIAVRFIDMQSDKKALELISQLKKPYLKALILTEYVKVNQKKQSKIKLRIILDCALGFVRNGKEEIFDSNKYDVYAIIARNYAEIGMPEKANDVFAEVLSKDKEMVKKGLDKYLLIAMCKIGVEFEKSGIKPNEKLKTSLRNIIKNWEAEEY